MAINYSKWDALELSDDSDIEVHPNVDKRSFILAKQNQIHMEREKRRHEIKTLRYESLVNEGLIARVDALVISLKAHADSVTGGNSDNFMIRAMMESAGDPKKDNVPEPPEDVHYREKQPGTYSEMMAGLVDQVKKDVGPSNTEWYKAYLKGVIEHGSKVRDLQKRLFARLAQLEKEEGSKITSDSIHDGFNTSSVSKKKEPAQKPKQKAETVEVLNPGVAKTPSLNPADNSDQTSGADADVDEPVSKSEDDANTGITKLAKEFAQIEIGKYKKCLLFISDHPEIVAERNQDDLLMEAFNASMDGEDGYCKKCVHQALLLQYCRTLGKDGVGLFFKRVTTPGHNAQKVFIEDVNQTYQRIRTRAAEIAKERAENSKSDEDIEGVEQIQLHAVEPGSQININVPQPNSSEPVEQAARKVFESFPPGLQRALENESLDRVNEVLGKMSVSEAEEVVEQLGEAGMLSMEKGVIDGTTAAGKQKLKELEREAAEEEQVPFETEAALRELEVGKDGEGEVTLKELEAGKLSKAKEVEVADVD